MKTIFKLLKNVLKLNLAIVLLSTIVLFSCKKEKDEENPTPNGQALESRIIENRKDAVQQFTIDPAVGGLIIGEQGTKVYFPPNSFGLNGQPVTGNVEVELIEIYDKGSAVLLDMSTTGKKPNGDEEALNSAGEFFLNAKQGETDLELLNPAIITSKGVNPEDFEPMNVFRAGDNLEDKDKWEEADEDEDGETDEADAHEGEGPTGDYVLVSIFDVSSFGWTNLDRWYSFTGPKTTLFVDVPDGFDQTNSNVYLSYDGETGLAKMDIWDTDQEMFTEHYGSLPIGMDVHFIMIADIDGQLYYKIQGNTIVDNHIEVIEDLQPISEQDLSNAINALP
jgi:hypothetical protein